MNMLDFVNETTAGKIKMLESAIEGCRGTIECSQVNMTGYTKLLAEIKEHIDINLESDKNGIH